MFHLEMSPEGDVFHIDYQPRNSVEWEWVWIVSVYAEKLVYGRDRWHHWQMRGYA